MEPTGRAQETPPTTVPRRPLIMSWAVGRDGCLACRWQADSRATSASSATAVLAIAS